MYSTQCFGVLWVNVQVDHLAPEILSRHAKNHQGAFAFFIQNVDNENDFTIVKELIFGELVLE